MLRNVKKKLGYHLLRSSYFDRFIFVFVQNFILVKYFCTYIIYNFCDK